MLREQTIESHVNINVDMAIDQAHEFGGLEGAFHSYLQNTMDSVAEDGYTADESLDAGDWFCRKFTEKTGLFF